MTGESRRPADPASWNQRYLDGDLPWDSGKEDEHLGRVIEKHCIEPGHALEVGCGTGTNTIWLAQQGFEMTGLDLAETVSSPDAPPTITAGQGAGPATAVPTLKDSRDLIATSEALRASIDTFLESGASVN